MGMNHKLMEPIASPENLLQAWRHVRGNIPRYRRSRSSGPDGVSISAYDENLTTELSFLSDALMSGRYQPEPPSCFKIAKPLGGQRSIAVLNVSDRVAQRAAQQVLEPIWNPIFLDCSFGFRPGLSVQDAITCAQQHRVHEQRWCVDGDITDCFSTLDHPLLIKQIQRRVSDQRVIALINKWLEVGVISSGPPQEQESFVEKSQSVANWVQQGMQWILGDGNDQAYLPPSADAYPYARYESLGEEAGYGEQAAYRPPQRNFTRQIATNGALLGASWARRRAGKIGQTVSGLVKTPAGKQMLRKSALVSTAIAGVAVAGAATAYVLNQKTQPSPAGVLQGSPISPLFANIYLHLFDLMMTERKHALVRYADDWVVLSATRKKAEKAYKDAEWALGRLRLHLNPEKTHIRHPDEKIEWLGGLIH